MIEIKPITRIQDAGRRIKATCICFILVKNGAATIGRGLDSAIKSGCFDKILVVLDSKSSDDTGRIVSEYAEELPQIHIVSYRWSDPPDFAAARNFALNLINTDYAFWLDADEVLADSEGLRGLLCRPGPAYLMWVDSALEKGWHNMYQPRLIPMRPGVKFECPVFERVDWSLNRAGIQMIPTDLRVINHDGYVNTQVLRQKNVRNRAILKKWLERKNRSWWRPFRPNSDQDRHMMEQYRRLV